MDKKLAELLSDVFGLSASDIKPELQKCDVGTWDSLKQMDLVISLERNFGIALEIPDIIRMTSVAEIIKVLEEKGVSVGD
jgi:acyl carrier protein